MKYGLIQTSGSIIAFCNLLPRSVAEWSLYMMQKSGLNTSTRE